MDTRKYDSQTRKEMKREQRHPQYTALQARAFADRSRLEALARSQATDIKKLEATIGTLNDKVKDQKSQIDAWIAKK